MTASSRESDWARLGEYLGRDGLLLGGARRAELAEEWSEIQRLEDDLDDSILVGLVGGTGVGKSTFVNALAASRVSTSDDRRPTTDRVVAYRHVSTELPVDVPVDDLARPMVLHENADLERVIVLDFPDFDSAETSHRDVLDRYLDHLDILLVVVDDVKYGDRRLYELLRGVRHDPANLYALFNKIDRLSSRYGERTDKVVAELLSDLRKKFHDFAGIEVSSAHTFPIAALEAFRRRTGEGTTFDADGFDAIERVLGSYREEKRRREAKRLNLEARRAALVSSVRDEALSDEHRSTVQESAELVASWRSELARTMTGISVSVLTDRERRSQRRDRMRRIGPRWGLPFSLLFSALADFRIDRRGANGTGAGPLSERLCFHYRACLEALRNLEVRFRAELAGTPLARIEPERERGAELEPWTNDLAERFRETIDRGSSPPGRWAVRFAHAPAIAVALLGVWGVIHPALDSLIRGTGSGFFTELGMAFFAALAPTSLIAYASGILFAYLATGAFLWYRSAQELDRNIDEAESELRREIVSHGSTTVGQYEARVRDLQDELELVERITSASRAR